MRARLATLAGGCAGAIALLGTPSAAAACAVCGSSQSRENQMAYLVTTGFLTLLPLLLVAGLILWIRKRVRDLDREVVVAQVGEGARLSAVPHARRHDG